ncbi:Hypothetical predicted protein [Pelobates cultripes]|uniref:Uncharacterized protein n=1 Tax=Pelobates cultripes TaxID=61616 RepID=A0AAD1TDY1_PELCU|nr:Hypothetical predicted protein [Pelobates cultripes]
MAAGAAEVEVAGLGGKIAQDGAKDEERSCSPHPYLAVAAEVTSERAATRRKRRSAARRNSGGAYVTSADVTGPCQSRKSQSSLDWGIGGGAPLAPGKVMADFGVPEAEEKTGGPSTIISS